MRKLNRSKLDVVVIGAQGAYGLNLSTNTMAEDTNLFAKKQEKPNPVIINVSQSEKSLPLNAQVSNPQQGTGFLLRGKEIQFNSSLKLKPNIDSTGSILLHHDFSVKLENPRVSATFQEGSDNVKINCIVNLLHFSESNAKDIVKDVFLKTPRKMMIESTGDSITGDGVVYVFVKAPLIESLACSKSITRTFTKTDGTKGSAKVIPNMTIADFEELFARSKDVIDEVPADAQTVKGPESGSELAL